MCAQNCGYDKRKEGRGFPGQNEGTMDTQSISHNRSKKKEEKKWTPGLWRRGGRCCRLASRAGAAGRQHVSAASVNGTDARMHGICASRHARASTQSTLGLHARIASANCTTAAINGTDSAINRTNASINGTHASINGGADLAPGVARVAEHGHVHPCVRARTWDLAPTTHAHACTSAT